MASHFLMYYDNRIREVITTAPRTWAKANMEHFPNYTFIGRDHPTVDVIENYIVANYGFVRNQQTDFVVCYNFNQTIPPANGLNFIL